MGMVSSCRALELAIEKAKKTGIAYVGVHNSCHFGAAGYYANLAAQQGLLGIAMSNTDPNMAIPGSRDVAIGNNPFSFAAPLKNGKSVFLDLAERRGGIEDRHGPRKGTAGAARLPD